MLTISRQQRTRVLRWTEEAIRQWNWPLVESGEITHDELNEEISRRKVQLRKLHSTTLMHSILTGLPDDVFYRA